MKIYGTFDFRVREKIEYTVCRVNLLNAMFIKIKLLITHSVGKNNCARI